jgi:hypothetical protein
MSSVTVSLDKLGKALENQIKKDMKQVRFAAFKAVNEVAFKKVKPGLATEFKKSFTVRNTKLPQRVQIKKGTRENPVAEVSFPHDWMYINTKGGDKKPEKSMVLMVPIKDGGLKDFRLSSGRIKRGMTAGALLKYADAHPKKTKAHVATPHAFKNIKNKKGQDIIAIRDKSNRKQMKWLYVGVPVAKVMKRWDFEEIVRKIASRELPLEFDKQLKHAIATAK